MKSSHFVERTINVVPVCKRGNFINRQLRMQHTVTVHSDG